jgi:hypothetical protein
LWEAARKCVVFVRRPRIQNARLLNQAARFCNLAAFVFRLGACLSMIRRLAGSRELVPAPLGKPALS